MRYRPNKKSSDFQLHALKKMVKKLTLVASMTWEVRQSIFSQTSIQVNKTVSKSSKQFQQICDSQLLIVSMSRSMPSIEQDIRNQNLESRRRYLLYMLLGELFLAHTPELLCKTACLDCVLSSLSLRLLSAHIVGSESQLCHLWPRLLDRSSVYVTQCHRISVQVTVTR